MRPLFIKVLSLLFSTCLVQARMGEPDYFRQTKIWLQTPRVKFFGQVIQQFFSKHRFVKAVWCLQIIMNRYFWFFGVTGFFKPSDCWYCKIKLFLCQFTNRWFFDVVWIFSVANSIWKCSPNPGTIPDNFIFELNSFL